MNLYDFIGEAKPLVAPVQQVMHKTTQMAPKTPESHGSLESYIVVTPFHEEVPVAIWSDAVFLTDRLQEEAHWSKMR
jgi:hypothetical protein